MAKKNRRRSRKERDRQLSPTSSRDGVPVDAPGAPAEGSDAGSAADLYSAYKAKQVATFRREANQHLASAKQLIATSRAKADGEARAALYSASRAFWWAEESPLEEAQHTLLHRIGRWTRRNLGCQLHFDGTSYSHTCPVVVAHKRIGFSMAFEAKRFCSLCDGDLSECPHMRDRSYWVRGPSAPGETCRVCGDEGCRHRADRLYRAPVVSMVKEVEKIREISLVRRPAMPEARLTAVPISTQDLADFLGPEFKVGMPVSCDQCLSECPGIEDPLANGPSSASDSLPAPSTVERNS
jgi:hypothetical protein